MNGYTVKCKHKNTPTYTYTCTLYLKRTYDGSSLSRAALFSRCVALCHNHHNYFIKSSLVSHQSLIAQRYQSVKTALKFDKQEFPNTFSSSILSYLISDYVLCSKTLSYFIPR